VKANSSNSRILPIETLPKLRCAPARAGVFQDAREILAPALYATRLGDSHGVIVAMVLVMRAWRECWPNLMLARAASPEKRLTVRVAIGAAAGPRHSTAFDRKVFSGLAGGALGCLWAHWGAPELVEVKQDQGHAQHRPLCASFDSPLCMGMLTEFSLDDSSGLRSRQSFQWPLRVRRRSQNGTKR